MIWTSKQQMVGWLLENLDESLQEGSSLFPFRRMVELIRQDLDFNTNSGFPPTSWTLKHGHPIGFNFLAFHFPFFPFGVLLVRTNQEIQVS